MRAITPASLAESNLAYREPALYDELLATDAVTDEILDAVDRAALRPGSVLDLGCGTGRVLAELHARRGWDVTGVDLQPDLLDYASSVYPGLALHPGDLRTVRLGARFDLLLCLGNTLSYLHTEQELAAAFDTFAAHAGPAALLVVATLDTPRPDTHGSSHVDSRVIGTVDIEASTRSNVPGGLVETSRSWRFPDGHTELDTFTRRIWSRPRLTEEATRVSLTKLPASTHSTLTLCARARDDIGHQPESPSYLPSSARIE